MSGSEHVDALAAAAAEQRSPSGQLRKEICSEQKRAEAAHRDSTEVTHAEGAIRWPRSSAADSSQRLRRLRPFKEWVYARAGQQGSARTALTGTGQREAARPGQQEITGAACGSVNAMVCQWQTPNEAADLLLAVASF